MAFAFLNGICPLCGEQKDHFLAYLCEECSVPTVDTSTMDTRAVSVSGEGALFAYEDGKSLHVSIHEGGLMFRRFTGTVRYKRAREVDTSQCDSWKLYPSKKRSIIRYRQARPSPSPSLSTGATSPPPERSEFFLLRSDVFLFFFVVVGLDAHVAAAPFGGGSRPGADGGEVVVVVEEEARPTSSSGLRTGEWRHRQRRADRR